MAAFSSRGLNSIKTNVVHWSYCRSQLCTFGHQLPQKNRLWDSDFTSLEARSGFLRSSKEYNPPPNVRDLVKSVCSEFLGSKITSTSADVPLGDAILRYKILTACIERFKHDIPNYELHKLITVGDLVAYFERAVQGNNPYDVLCNRTVTDAESYPPNLHVQPDYVRFHPESDAAFHGVSAFPRSSTIVTGLKYKKKYRGYKAASAFDDV